MKDSVAINGLKRKRAQIAGLVADHEKKARRWKTALAHVDATLRIFSDDIDPEGIPTRRVYRVSQYLSGPKLSRFCLDELRRADGRPISAGQIYEAAAKAHGIPDDPRTKVGLTERILRYLRERQEAGSVVKHGTTHDAKWAFAAEPSLLDGAANSR